jgi:hypothetical protein
MTVGRKTGMELPEPIITIIYIIPANGIQIPEPLVIALAAKTLPNIGPW